jgi:AraC family transcriptional regulator
MAVQLILQKLNIPYQRIEIGWVEIGRSLNESELIRFNEELNMYELELIKHRSTLLVERIKIEIHQLLIQEKPMQLKLSAFLSQSLGYNYNYLANTFSDHEGTTLERYYIGQRIERVKELIIYENLPLITIAEKLGYSSVSHLCLQFKKVTGITAAEFKKCFLKGNYVWKNIS